MHRRITGTHGYANLRQEQAALARSLQDLAERDLEIFLDVVAERLERRNVQHLGLVREFPAQRFAHQGVNAGQKCGQRFARAGGRGNDGAAASQDVRPARLLRLCRSGEALEEPLAYDRVGPIERSRSGAAGRQ